MFTNIDDDLYMCTLKKRMDEYPRKEDNGVYTITYNTPGISPQDIKVEIVGSELRVSGKSTYNKESYKCDYSLFMEDKFISSIKEVKYKVENGITTIFFYVNDVKKDIKISKI